MRQRIFVTFVLALSLFIGAFATQAQDGCFGLSEGDCTVIQSASANTLTAAQSFYQDYTITFSVLSGGTGINGTITGSGSVVLGNVETFFDGLDQVVSFAVTTPDGEQTGASGLIFVDGVLYLDLGGGTYGSVNLFELASNPDFMNSIPGLDALNNLGGMGGGETTPEQQAQAQAMMMLAFSLPSLLETPQVFSYTRAGDTFTWTADLAKLLQSPQLGQMLQTIGAMGGEEAAGQVQMATLATRQIKNAVITVTQRVDTGANIVTGITFSLDATLAGALLGAPDDVVANLVFNVDLSRVNESFTITAPASSVPLIPAMGN